MLLFSNAKRAPATFLSVMYTLVQATKSKDYEQEVYIRISFKGDDDLGSLLSSTKDDDLGQAALLSFNLNLGELKEESNLLSSKLSESSLTSFITLSETVAALEEVSIAIHDISSDRKVSETDETLEKCLADKVLNNLLAHNASEEKFNLQHHQKYITRSSKPKASAM